MPSIVTRIVAYAGYPGQTDLTLASAIAAVPANLVTADEQWDILIGPSAVGVYSWDLGTFGGSTNNLGSKTTDATRYVRFAAVPGLSFSDNGNKLTNGLRYNASNGIALFATQTWLIVAANFTRIEGLQFNKTTNGSISGLQVNCNNCKISSCIFEGSKALFVKTNNVITGCLFADYNSSPSDAIINTELASVITSNTFYTTASAASAPIKQDFAASVFRNNTVFGFAAISIAGGGGQIDVAAGSTNNITNLSTGPTNFSGLFSKTASNQFTSLTVGSEDFRIKAGADVINAGVRDQTYTNDLDIVGSARSTTAPTIGAWEFASITYTYARPTSDITTQWSPSTGTDHYALIDETTANDADYIYATAAGQTDEVRLASMTAPQAGTDLLINYRVQGIVGSASVTLSLVCNTTVHATDTTRTANGDYTLTVPSGTWASVADWTNMRLRFVSA